MTIKTTGMIFQTAMVQAMIAGPKRYTRRLVAAQPTNDGSGGVMREADSWIWRAGDVLLRAGYGADYVHTQRDAMTRIMVELCPYGCLGSLLWVRETFSQQADGHVLYAADYPRFADRPNVTWKSSRFMPRKLSRATLRLTSVEAERLQDITYLQAIEEGVTYEKGYTDPREAFQRLWDSIHGDGAWAANPWVYALGFDFIRGNVDDVVKALETAPRNGTVP